MSGSFHSMLQVLQYHIHSFSIMLLAIKETVIVLNKFLSEIFMCVSLKLKSSVLEESVKKCRYLKEMYFSPANPFSSYYN